MLDVRNLHCGILKGVSLSLRAESCLGVTGPSGSGKTTLLSAIAGNLPYSGAISYAGRDLAEIKAWKRPFRYLNQRLYLFPYLTVENNLRLAQYATGMPFKGAAARQARRDMLGELGILPLAGSHPGRISGGEQQRAALARALISSPRLLLLDEPFSSLDWELREKLWKLLARLRRNFRLSMLLVSHEPKEIEALADGFLALKNGETVNDSAR